MAYIKIDHSQFKKVSSAINTYIRNYNANMSAIDREMISLNTYWKGKDYNQVKTEWNQINSKGATSDKMITALKNYSEYLKTAEAKYKKAQANAVNRANSLPNY